MNRSVRAAVTGVTVIAALAAGRAITQAMPNDLASQRGGAEPFIVHGSVGQTTSLRYMRIKVVDVRPAKAIKTIVGWDSTYANLVLVDLELRARSKPLALGNYSLLTPDGRRYSADTRWAVGEVPTGFRWHATPVFEVPDDAIEGAVLEISQGRDWWGQRRDDLLRVDLGLSAADARAFVANRDIVPSVLDRLAPPDRTAVGEVPDE